MMGRPFGTKNISRKSDPFGFADDIDNPYGNPPEAYTRGCEKFVIYIPNTLMDIIDLKRGPKTRHDFLIQVLMYTMIKKKMRHNYQELLDSMVQGAKEEALNPRLRNDRIPNYTINP
jgi:hypothetical protein